MALASAVCLCALVAVAGTVLAISYLGAVRQAEAALAVPHVRGRDVARAQSALFSGVACSQPEISSDLGSNPPDVPDARQRLQALDRALSQPPKPAPGVAAELRRLASTSRYQREQPESPGDLFTGWVQGREAAIQATVCGGALPLLLRLLGIAALVAAAIAAAIIAYRQYRARSRGAVTRDVAPDALRRRNAEQRFAAADRLAHAGDLAAAIRELAGAVATVLGGEAAWDVSPLTVRELFTRAGVAAQLRPLLLGFEEAVYGHRPVDRALYDSAAAVAEAYRPGRRRVA